MTATIQQAIQSFPQWDAIEEISKAAPRMSAIEDKQFTAHYNGREEEVGMIYIPFDRSDRANADLSVAQSKHLGRLINRAVKQHGKAFVKHMANAGWTVAEPYGTIGGGFGFSYTPSV